MKIKVAAVQMETTQDRRRNIEKILAFIDKAGEMGVELVCFHEYSITEPPEETDRKEEILKKAEAIPGPFTEAIGEQARKNRLFVVPGSLIEVFHGKLFNTAPLIGPDGHLIGKFSKMHPENVRAKYEIGCGITPGNEYPIFETKIGKIAIMIDMDGSVPMVPEIYSLQGAEIICWPINWSARWHRAVGILSQAHGIFTKCHILSANRVGLRKNPSGNITYLGGTQITDPEGNMLSAVSDSYEGFAVTEVNLELTKRWREEVIPLSDPVHRRPETYALITKANVLG
jgi:N-carbamoylputrescine amidase